MPGKWLAVPRAFSCGIYAQREAVSALGQGTTRISRATRAPLLKASFPFSSGGGGVKSGPFISAGGGLSPQALHPVSKATLRFHPHLPKCCQRFRSRSSPPWVAGSKTQLLEGGVGSPSPDKITAALNIKCQRDSASHPVPISGAGLAPPSPQALQAGCCAEIVCSLCAPGFIHAWQVGALIKAEGRGGQQTEQIGFAWSKTLYLGETRPRKS